MGRPRTIDHAEVVRLREQEGLSYPQIAERLGIDHTSALYICNAAFADRKREAIRERAAIARRDRRERPDRSARTPEPAPKGDIGSEAATPTEGTGS